MLSLLPMKVSVVELEEPLDEPELEPELEPEPPLTVPPLPGSVRVEPLVEKTMLPFWSVRYTFVPAVESLESAAEVGCP